MSSNNRFISIEAKKAAIAQISKFIKNRANKCSLVMGYSFFATENAPETFKELKLQTVDKVIPIASYGADSSIYDCRETNILFRFYHDVAHLEHNKGFNTQDEHYIANLHITEFVEFGASSLAVEIFRNDTIGQIEYYNKHKDFVCNQMAFMDSCLSVGIVNAIKVKH